MSAFGGSTTSSPVVVSTSTGAFALTLAARFGVRRRRRRRGWRASSRAAPPERRRILGTVGWSFPRLAVVLRMLPHHPSHTRRLSMRIAGILGWTRSCRHHRTALSKLALFSVCVLLFFSRSLLFYLPSVAFASLEEWVFLPYFIHLVGPLRCQDSWEPGLRVC